MSGSTASEPWLESAQGQRTALGANCSLGRGRSCEVVIADAKVSRQHALISIQAPGEFWLIDLGSVNGTYLNDRRVVQPTRLSHGDKIAIAGHTFTFRNPHATTVSPADATRTDATITEVRKLTCWLLVADLIGSTQLVHKLSLEEAHQATGAWLVACTRILQQHHGAINKFLGDGFLAYWQDQHGCAKQVAETLIALKQLQQAQQPHFRVVLHYGTVLAGGQASLGEESLTGNDMNFVFRLEKLAGSLGLTTLMSQPAHAALGALLPAIPVGEHTLAGFPEPFSFFSF